MVSAPPPVLYTQSVSRNSPAQGCRPRSCAAATEMVGAAPLIADTGRQLESAQGEDQCTQRFACTFSTRSGVKRTRTDVVCPGGSGTGRGGRLISVSRGCGGSRVIALMFIVVLPVFVMNTFSSVI